MDQRAQALAAAAGTGLLARAAIYSVSMAVGQGQFGVIPLDAAIKAVMVVLIGGGFAWVVARGAKSWAIVLGIVSWLFACAMVYLETLFRFPALLAKLSLWDFALVFIQWLGVSATSALVATYVLRGADWSAGTSARYRPH